jgi:hypothetical protein
MSNIENAVLKSRNLINSAIEKNKLNGKYFEFSFPWIFNEFLGFLREEKKLKIEFYRRNYKIKHLIYKWYLNCFHFTNSLKVGKYDVLFIGSYSGHYKIYKELENELLVNGLTYIYLTDKIELYKEIKADGGKVVFLNINLTSKLINSFNGRNEAFDNLINETINLNIKYFQNLETIFIKTFTKFSPKVIVTANELLTEHRAAIIIGKEIAVNKHNIFPIPSKPIVNLLPNDTNQLTSK